MRSRAPEGSARPFRLWDAREKHDLRYRYYVRPRNAHLGALIETRWSRPGTTIEVYDARNGRLYGQYTRTTKSIQFMR